MSEFTGRFQKNTLPDKDKDAPLSPEEKLRLIYLTGQEDDVHAAPDRSIWLGIDPVEKAARDKVKQARVAKKLKIKRRANGS